MTRLRLLPIVLFAVTALLCLKLLGLASGIGSFAVGPAPASAQAGAPPMPDFLGAPLDLAAEAEALRRQEAAAAAAAAGDSPPSPPETVDPAQSDIAMDPDSAVPMDAPVAEAPVAEAPPPSEPAPAAAPPADPNAPVLTTERPQEFSPPARTSERQVLESLADRRRDLDAREADLALRTKLLEAAEAKVQARIDELKAIEAQLGEAASTTEGAEQESLKGLVTMYEAMKPKAAARVFNDLNMSVLLAVSKAMNPRKMSAILAVMNAEKAGMLTTAIAGNQSPREVIVRRDDGMSPPPTDAQPSPDDLPKIMPAG